MTDYLELRCLWPADQEDVLLQALESVPILGAQAGGVAGGSMELLVFVAEGLDVEATRLGGILSRAGARGLELRRFHGQDWLAEYRAAALPFPVGDQWWIDPHPSAAISVPGERLRLVVEPRSAFGSGSHESTRLVLTILEEIPVRAQRVIDIGTGSGILAVAAAALGARHVVGLDIDLEAAFVARQTLAQQDAALDVALFAGEIDAVAGDSFDLILCNMISSRFLPMLDDIRGLLAPAGRIVLSGFLGSEDDHVQDAVKRVGLRFEMGRILGEWAALTAVIRGR